MKQSLKSLIYDHLKSHYPNFVHKGDLEKMSDEWGFMADNIARRTRELCNEGLIERELVKGIATYKWIDKEIRLEDMPEYSEWNKIKVATLF